MSTLMKHSCMLLFALPVAAMADPVAVTTQSSGSSGADDTVLQALGLAPAAGTAPQPYALTLDSRFDPATNPSTSDAWAFDGGEVTIDFRIGGQAYHYEGIASSSVNLVPQAPGVDSYVHHIWFDTAGAPNANYTVHFYHTLYGLPGSMGLGGPLDPRDTDEGAGAYGYYTISAFPGNPEVPLSWSMGASASTLSVQVAPVPEPAAFVLLAGGLVTLGLRRRFSAAR